MIVKTFKFWTILVGCLLLPEISIAEICLARENLITQLSLQHGEKITAQGLISNGMVMELLVSTEGNWTILISRSDGISCVAATGEGWQTIEVGGDDT
jgi:hypothetical protein|tara:strand:- start:130 stop:423 length:294 start_codon:yes stop_codon:yes gene_type:complete